jgi:hypothetical protein
MSDIDDLSEEEKEQTQKWFDETYIERDKYSELEAENARLQAKNTELFEKFDKFGWQSADKLPEEEGEYAVEHLDGSRVFRDLELLKSELALLIVKKYLKLPDVEEK